MAGPEQKRFPGSFDAFYRIEYPRVVALTYALGGRAAAEDLAQEAFLRAHRDWERVGRMEAPRAWVRRVAVNLCRSRWRRIRSEAVEVLRTAILWATREWQLKLGPVISLCLK